MSAGLVLAVVLGAGRIPIASSIERFPDPSSWPGTRIQQVANMLTEIERDAAPQLRTVGPGPAQLAARWASGQLDQAERVAVLLGGGTFHDLVMLPVYADALLSPVLRERQAAMVGLAWLIGDPSPDPTRWSMDSPIWNQASAFARNLEWDSHRRSLIRIWIDSYLDATGVPSSPGHRGLDRTPEQCLAAIREVAQPEDLGELFALWPMLDKRGRFDVLRTIEMITVQRYREVPRGPRAVSGEWIEANAATLVDGWIGNACGPVDGLRVAARNMARLADSFGGAQQPYAGALASLLTDYPSAWPVAAEALIGFGGPAVAFDRRFFDDPMNSGSARRVLATFPVTTEQLKRQTAATRRSPTRMRR